MGTSLLFILQHSKCLLVPSYFLFYHFPTEFLFHLSAVQVPTPQREEKRNNKQTLDLKLWDVVHRTAALHCFLLFSFSSLRVTSTQSANWSEPPLYRAHWPPTPTLQTVADCQVENSMCVYLYVCVVKLQRTIAQTREISKYLQTISQHVNLETQTFCRDCTIPPQWRPFSTPLRN